jgi:lysophospholipase L1-like esterase
VIRFGRIRALGRPSPEDTMQRSHLLRRSALALFSAGALLASPSAQQHSTKPALRVFLLAGQSNMEGQGVVDLDDPRDYNGGRGTLDAFLDDAENAAEFADLRDEDGRYAARDDVFVTYRPANGPKKAGPLDVGFAVYGGKHHIGPELGIGRVLGDRFEEPVLLVKTAWGGKSLHVDFRPPTAGGEVGPFYVQMLGEYRDALASLAEDHPPLAGLEPRLEGVIWFQGWNDACDRDATAAYAQNLPHLIGDLRAEFDDPTLPFVVGETGNWAGQEFRDAQRAGCADPAVAAGTTFVPTRHLLRDAEDSPNKTHGHHWFGNAESYLRAGTALGEAAASLVDARPRPAVPDGEDPLRWANDISAFDAVGPVQPGAVVFVGSSSIRLWSTLAEDMAPVPVLNRGFGGSHIYDSVFWSDRLVARYQPSAIVVFAGTNDISGDEPRSAAFVAEGFDALVEDLRRQGTGAPIAYIAISPAPSRARHQQIVEEANRLIAARCAADPTLHFVDTATGLLDADGKPDPRWFRSDQLHLNADGYAHWAAKIRPLVHRLHAESGR